ncbi:MAG: acyl-CoA thioesterase [Clostridiales bacterium]|nr:acyl-CoA thioesterase [Clostridiales bacterium]
MKKVIIHRLVKSEDLNHHGTLFAGRASEWFVEAGFIAAAKLTNPVNIVCKNIHGMVFQSPVKKGEVIRLESSVVLTGRTKIVVYVKIMKSETKHVVDGFMTFVHVNDDGNPVPHGLDEILPSDDEEAAIIRRAKELFEKK